VYFVSLLFTIWHMLLNPKACDFYTVWQLTFHRLYPCSSVFIRGLIFSEPGVYANNSQHHSQGVKTRFSYRLTVDLYFSAVIF